MLVKCSKCGFVLNHCYCNQRPEKIFRKIKERIITWSIKRQIHFSLFLEKWELKYRILKNILKSKINRIRFPNSEKITLSLRMDDLEVLLNNCLFANDKTTIKKIFINTNLDDTTRKIKKKFNKISTEYLMEFHRTTTLPRRERATEIRKDIPEIRVHKSNIPKKPFFLNKGDMKAIASLLKDDDELEKSIGGEIS